VPVGKSDDHDAWRRGSPHSHCNAGLATPSSMLPLIRTNLTHPGGIPSTSAGVCWPAGSAVWHEVTSSSVLRLPDINALNAVDRPFGEPPRAPSRGNT